MSAKTEMLYCWDVASTGRTNHLFAVLAATDHERGGRPACNRDIRRARCVRHVHHKLACPVCLKIAQEMNKETNP